MKKILPVLFITALIVGSYIGISAFQPPRITFDEQTKTITDAQDMLEPQLAVTMEHLKQMTKEAHPIGSKANQNVREYIIEQIETIGYIAEEQNFSSTDTEVIAYSTPEGMPLPDKIDMTNIMVQVKGTNSKATTFVVAHFDSTKYGPGAADDAIAVASILETMRVLKANPQQQNDIVFLLTDGEEAGLLGAEYFVEAHPQWKDTATFLVNFEARGNRGGLVMFQTADNNLAMLQHLLKATSSPIAVSIATEVYNRVPNGTDLTEFLNAGYTGVMNFAIIEGAENYHTPNDSYENINRDTANHYLLMISELATYFGSIDNPTKEATEDAIYFPIAKGKIVAIPNTIATILTVVAAILTLIWLIRTIYKKKITTMDFGLSIITLIAILGSACLIGIIGKLLTTSIFGVEENITAFLRWPGAPYLFIISVLLTLVSTFSILMLVNKKQQLFTAFSALYLSLLLLLSFALLYIMPGAAYLFSIPLLLTIIGHYIVDACPLDKKAICKKIVAICLTISYLILFAPVIYLLYVALTIPALYIITILTSFVLAGFGSFYLLNHSVDTH